MFKDGGWVKALLFRKISLYGQSLGRNAFVAELRSAAQVGHLGPHGSRTGRCPHLPSGVLATVPNEPCRAALGRPGGTPGPTWFAKGQVSSPAQRSVSFGPKRTLPSCARPPRWDTWAYVGKDGRGRPSPRGHRILTYCRKLRVGGLSFSNKVDWRLCPSLPGPRSVARPKRWKAYQPVRQAIAPRSHQ